MKFWRSEDPRLQRAYRVLRWVMLGLVSLYILFSVVLAILTRDQFMGGWVVLGLMGLAGLFYGPILLAVARFIGWRMTVKHGAEVPDHRMDRVLSIITFVSGMLALALFLVETLVEVDFGYPWDNLRVMRQMTLFMTAALAVSLASLLLNYGMQGLLRFAATRSDRVKGAVTARGLRRVAAVALSLILLGFLLIPYDRGTYNDGGSRFWRATLYEVIWWDRGYDEDAMALPDGFDPRERQHTRIYLFPFNCYTFNAKWERKH